MKLSALLETLSRYDEIIITCTELDTVLYRGLVKNSPDQYDEAIVVDCDGIDYREYHIVIK